MLHRKCPPGNSKHSGDFDPISAGDSCNMDDPEGAVAPPQICGRRRMRPVKRWSSRHICWCYSGCRLQKVANWYGVEAISHSEVETGSNLLVVLSGLHRSCQASGR